uniref:Penicillin-binding protein 2 n=1 Tax=candidate division WWE3 bacterium TaxID=2053526 RepID=A0A831Z2K4_UNCKA
MDRLKITTFFTLLGFALVILRLFQIQIISHEYYQMKAEAAHRRGEEIPAERGKIFASGGVLVTNEEAYRVSANPQKVEDPEGVAEKLVAVFMEDSRFLSYNPVPVEEDDPRAFHAARIAELLARKEQRGVDLARKVAAAQVAKIKGMSITGLFFSPDERRFYPEGPMAAPLTGFVAFDEDGRDQGYNGLEGYYNGDLRGKAGRIIREYDERTGDPILIGDSTELAAQKGADLYLTIHRGVQGVLERKIAEGVRRYGAKSGSFVVLDARTGYVLAMGNYPSFDPGNFNAPQEEGNPYPREFRNLALATTYEPGSVMKGITLAAGLDSGKITPAWEFVDDGPLKLGATTINTWDGKHWGKQNLAQLLQKSNNVGAAKLALEIDRDTLRSYFLNFGFGSQLGIDLEGEEAGLVKELKEWRQVDLANAGFGQGVGVTALQMVSAYAAIANGGVLMKPQVVERLIDRNGRQVNFSPEPIRRVISPETSEVLVELLRTAVEGGESVALRDLNYRISGKTGTAQIPVEGKYDPNKTNATFVGFPFKDRSFVMLIRLEEPSSSTFSATTVVPLWVEVFREIAPLFGISPDR